MKRVYSALRPPIDQKSYADWITKCQQRLSVSVKGLLAFTSSFCLNQRRPSTTSYHVYVADVNLPYQPYLLVDSEYDFTIVEWDPSGTKLLVCDVYGRATIYTSKDYLISDWKPYFQQIFSAETFISAAWYHPGLVSTISVSVQNLKNPSNHLEYSDKVQQTKFGASLRLFGGKPAEGCILVSRTGLVCCFTLMTDGSVDVLSESLAPLRTRVEVADICHHKDGSFVVATSAGSINSTIAFYQIYLTSKNITLADVDSYENGRRVFINCKQFYSFHLNIMAQILIERENLLAFERVAHIKFVTKDCPDDVLVEVSGQNLSLMELWELEPKKRSPISSVIMDIKNSKEGDVKPQLGTVKEETSDSGCTSSSKEWTFKGNYITDKDLVSIQTPKFKIFGSNRQLNIILLSYKDSTVCCMRKEDLQPINEPLDLSYVMTLVNNKGSTGGGGGGGGGACGGTGGGTGVGGGGGSVGVGGGGGDTHKIYQNRNAGVQQKSPTKRTRQPIYITDMQLTSNQAVFVAIDTMSQLHAIRLPPLVACQDSKDQETYLQYLLEYSLVTGNDWWDVLVNVPQESIDNICDLFHDAYERQPKHLQRKYFNKQLMIRASLYRHLNDSASLSKSSDCHTMIMLNSIASTLKSMLRSQDQDNPGEYLSNFLKTQGTQATFFNCNNVISKLNEKEFYVETNLSQCLQPLIQWVVDLAAFLVVSTPQRVKLQAHFPGAGLAKSKEALETIRELLIIIKIWGLQNESSRPVVHKLSDQVDVLGALFKLISSAYAMIGGTSSSTTTSEAENETFLSECYDLANSIGVSQFQFLLNPIGVASPLLHHHNHKTSIKILQDGDSSSCLNLEFFKEPQMPELVALPRVEGAINMNGERQIDVVRNISLGAYPMVNLRHCTRCKSVSLINPSFQTTRVWEQRWISSCVCGGSWAQSDRTVVNKTAYLTWLHHNTTLSCHSHAHQLR